MAKVGSRIGGGSDEHSVHPQAQQILDGMAASGVPPIWAADAREGRAVVEANGAIIGAGPDVASVRDIMIAGQAGGIPARVYSPSADAPGVVVYYHGGGWVVGSVNDWDASVRALAVASGCDVVSVDYRLAPEHVFPAATDDAFDALRRGSPPPPGWRPGGRSWSPVTARAATWPWSPPCGRATRAARRWPCSCSSTRWPTPTWTGARITSTTGTSSS